VRGEAGDIGTARLALKGVSLNESKHFANAKLKMILNPDVTGVTTPVETSDASSQFLITWKPVEIQLVNDTEEGEYISPALELSIKLFLQIHPLGRSYSSVRSTCTGDLNPQDASLTYRMRFQHFAK
jgi:hypothetical protein